MDAAEFRGLRAATGLSLHGLADVLAMTGRHAATHLREMEDGVRRVPGPTGVALTLLAMLPSERACLVMAELDDEVIYDVRVAVGDDTRDRNGSVFAIVTRIEAVLPEVRQCFASMRQWTVK